MMMDKTTIISQAKVEYCSGFATWFDLKRKYPQLTADEIFYQVVVPINRELNSKAVTEHMKKFAD